MKNDKKKTHTLREPNAGYMRTIEEVRKIKRKISAEIKGMTSQEYFDYLDKNVAHLRERFKKKYVTLP